MSTIRLTRGSLFADILVDRRCRGERWIYVVQREGSPEILAMGEAPSERKAKDLAAEAMQQFLLHVQKKAC